MDKNFYIKTRKRLTNSIDSGAVILFSGEAPVKSGDSLYDFYVNRNFFYLTGINRDKMIFALVKNGENVLETLFIPRDNGDMARWVGDNMTVDEARELSGIEDIKFIDEFDDDFSDYIYRHNVKKVFLDGDNRFNRGAFSKALQFAENIKKSYPALLIENAEDVFASLRQIKEDEEIECIKKAISITKDGIYSMMKNVKPDMMEYEIEAYFDFELKRNGVKEPAFNTIAAGGKNAATLHYEDNNCVVKDGELILFDLGAAYNGYSADITRTFPINGKFSDEQKYFYDLVLRGQKLVIDKIRPGVPYGELNKVLRKFYVEELKKKGMVKTDSDLSEYYFHSVSHHLGLETHDVGDRNGLLKEGMVITVEPGIYIRSLGLGIRIEDDVVVTKDGCEVLSKDIIKEIDDIEKLMGGR